jgi:hypothetical protein
MIVLEYNLSIQVETHDGSVGKDPLAPVPDIIEQTFFLAFERKLAYNYV